MQAGILPGSHRFRSSSPTVRQAGLSRVPQRGRSATSGWTHSEDRDHLLQTCHLRRISPSPSDSTRNSVWTPETFLTTQYWASITPRAILVLIALAQLVMLGELPTSKITLQCGCSLLGCVSRSNTPGSLILDGEPLRAP